MNRKLSQLLIKTDAFFCQKCTIGKFRLLQKLKKRFLILRTFFKSSFKARVEKSLCTNRRKSVKSRYRKFFKKELHKIISTEVSPALKNNWTFFSLMLLTIHDYYFFGLIRISLKTYFCRFIEFNESDLVQIIYRIRFLVRLG